MLFNSVFFITIFLPMAVLGFYLLQRLRSPLPGRVFLTLMSLWFYGYYNPKYLAVLLGSLLFNHLMSLLAKRGKGLRLLELIGVAGNLLLLFVFKYFGFFLENVNYLLHADITVERIALPLGISFFTFQQISFIVDRCRRKADYYSFTDYACFVTFFPQLIAGPIVLHSEFLPQLTARENRRPDAEKVYRGLALFTLG
ncbi:MAG: MBOAT family protein, partial [Lachnospiraceae bacterium]|nr:MBOAT family protein [Lachnospiraceae bacterium]